MKFLGLSIVRAKAAQLLHSVTSRSNSWFGIVREPFTGAWQRNREMDTRETVLAFSAVFACVTRIANDVAKLPPVLKQQVGGIWTRVTSASPYWAALMKPNGFQNRIQFYASWLFSKLLHGNTYVLKQRDDRGIVNQLFILDPLKVRPMVTSDGGVYYSLGADLLSQLEDSVLIPASEIIHDRINTLFHPLIGVSPMYACAAAAGQGIRIQANSAIFFENMSRPSGVLTAPGEIPDELAKRLKDTWQENFTGQNMGKIAVLGSGLKYEGMGTIPANEAQLIEQLRWTVEDVARAFGVPLYKINAGPVPTSNNVESLNQQYYTDCLQTHIEAIELCLDEGLGLVSGRGAPYGVEFDLDVLLRMDSASLIASMRDAIGAGFVAPNEARQKINLPPVEGGNSPMIQQQNFSLAALSKRDQNDPFAKPAPAPTAAATPAQTSDSSSKPASDETTRTEAMKAIAKAMVSALEHVDHVG